MLHLDWLDYAERLLGPADWADAASIAALFGKAQALLPSDLIVVPVVRIAEAHVAARAGLHSAVASKPAEAQPLRALLGDAKLREMLAATLTRLQPGSGGAVLALGLPAPAMFAQAAAVSAGLPAPPANDDLADDAAVYIADFLRAFAAAPVAALLLGTDAFPEFDTPVIKVASHYGWRVLRDGALATATIPADTRPEDAAGLVAGFRAAMKDTA